MNTTGIEVGDPTPADWFDDTKKSCTAAATFLCTAIAGHDGPHVATGSGMVLEVWS
jgi:hypothetical protein